MFTRQTVLAAAIVAVLAVGLSSLSGCKRRPNPEQCQEICWKFNELHFWQAFEDETKDMTPDAKEKARQVHQEKWDAMKDRAFDPGLKNCITACKRGGEVSMVECMEKATTAAAARVCLPPVEN